MTDVVYIDDEAQLLVAISLLLEAQGLTVATFERPEEALHYINENEVGVILCDFRMPSMSGLDLMRMVPPEIPFFLYSGDIELDPAGVDRERLAGVLRKPMSPDDLAQILKRTLGRE